MLQKLLLALIVGTLAAPSAEAAWYAPGNTKYGTVKMTRPQSQAKPPPTAKKPAVRTKCLQPGGRVVAC